MRTLILAIGNAGCNIAETIKNGTDYTYLKGDRYVFADTDSADLERHKPSCDVALQLDNDCENFPKSLFDGVVTLRIIVGLGGNCGTKYAEIAARAAYAAGIRAIVILASTPFSFEGAVRQEKAQTAASRLQEIPAVVLDVFDNNKLIIKHPDLTFAEAFRAADKEILDNICFLSWSEHIHLRPGMYLDYKPGNGSQREDGLYTLVTKLINNSVDEFRMGHGRHINVSVTNKSITVRDYGNGIDLDKLDLYTTRIQGNKVDTETFKKTISLNGCGLRLVNALSRIFHIESFQKGVCKDLTFEHGGRLVLQSSFATAEPDGLRVTITPDEEIFPDFQFNMDVLDNIVTDYVGLNSGLSINLNGQKYVMENGLADWLSNKIEKQLGECFEKPAYPIIHLKNKDIEIAFTHIPCDDSQIYSFVNGHYTSGGGTHCRAAREHIYKMFADLSGKECKYGEEYKGLFAAINVNIVDPVFENESRTKLGSREFTPEGHEINTIIGRFIHEELQKYFQIHPEARLSLIEEIQKH